MGWESSGVVGFDLGPLVQGQMRTAKLKNVYSSLIIGPRDFGALSLRWIQFASVLRCARSSYFCSSQTPLLTVLQLEIAILTNSLITFLCLLTYQLAEIMASLCSVRICVNNFSKCKRPRDMLTLLLLKDTLSIEDDKLFKACRSVCSFVHQN